MSVSTTFAPSRTNRCADAPPKPISSPLIAAAAPVSNATLPCSRISPPLSRRRNTYGFQPRMRAPGTRLQTIEIGADVVAGQVQYLAAKPPVLLDLRLG